jgi:predicted ester cyclase
MGGSLTDKGVVMTTQPMPETEAMLITHDRVFNSVLNGRNLDLIPQVCTEGYAYHGPGDLELRGAGPLREMIEGYLTAFPDLHMAVEQRVVEGNRISTLWRATGTHSGPLDDIEPSGKKIDFCGQVIMRFEGSKIAEEWESFDELLMLRQIGAMPE